MLGKLGRNPAVGVAAAALVLVVGGMALCRSRGTEPLAGHEGQAVCVCLRQGHKFLAPAPAPGEAAPACPECGGPSAVARVFECPRGHLFVGFLERPPAPDQAAKAASEYARHLPHLLRPGLDKAWTPGGAGLGPVCPVCKAGVKRPVTHFKGLDLGDIHVGPVPAKGGEK